MGVPAWFMPLPASVSSTGPATSCTAVAGGLPATAWHRRLSLGTVAMTPLGSPAASSVADGRSRRWLPGWFPQHGARL